MNVKNTSGNGSGIVKKVMTMAVMLMLVTSGVGGAFVGSAAAQESTDQTFIPTGDSASLESEYEHENVVIEAQAAGTLDVSVTDGDGNAVDSFNQSVNSGETVKIERPNVSEYSINNNGDVSVGVSLEDSHRVKVNINALPDPDTKLIGYKITNESGDEVASGSADNDTIAASVPSDGPYYVSIDQDSFDSSIPETSTLGGAYVEVMANEETTVDILEQRSTNGVSGDSDAVISTFNTSVATDVLVEVSIGDTETFSMAEINGSDTLRTPLGASGDTATVTILGTDATDVSGVTDTEFASFDVGDSTDTVYSDVETSNLGSNSTVTVDFYRNNLLIDSEEIDVVADNGTYTSSRTVDELGAESGDTVAVVVNDDSGNVESNMVTISSTESLLGGGGGSGGDGFGGIPTNYIAGFVISLSTTIIVAVTAKRL